MIAENVINEKTVRIFHACNQHNNTKITRKMFSRNMLEKQNNTDFRQDIRVLLPVDTDYDFVMRKVIPLI